MSVSSYLGRHQPRTPTTPDEMEAMRRAAWLKQGIIVLDPTTITDDWTRRAVINEANRRYGKRRESRDG